MTHEDYLNDPLFQRLQWEVRNAFEAGYLAAKPQRGQSKLNPSKGEWHDAWIVSNSRAFLITNGLMTGQEGWK